MKFVYLIILITIVLSGSVILSGSALVEPYLRVDHEVTTPICVQGSEGAPDYTRGSTVTITLVGLGDPTPVEVVFAIDCSNTMKISDPKNARMVATKEFIKNLNKSSDRAGLVYWNNSIIESRVVNLTSEFDEIIAKLDKDISGGGVSPEGFTDFNRALNASIDMFSNKSKNTKKCIIFLSDGEPKPQWIPSIYTPPDEETSPVNRAKDAGIQIWTVGFYKDPSSIDNADEARLKEMAEMTGGNYTLSYNLTVQAAFREVYDQIRGLAGKNIIVEYHAPKVLNYSIPHHRTEGDNKVFVWKPEDIYIGKKWTKRFQVVSDNVGIFSLGNSPGSLVSYDTYDQKPEGLPIEDRRLEVDPCYYGCCYNITNILNFSISNLTYMEGGSFNFGSGSPCYYCIPSPGPVSGPSEKVVYSFLNVTCPECSTWKTEDGSKVNNINIAQITTIGTIPYWNGTDEPTGVINLTVSRAEAAIGAVLAFDVSGSMRLVYEAMGEEDRAAFAEANFSNLSIIGWDEDGAEGAGSGADHLMVPPRPLRESHEDVLAAISNLSRLCGETDQTVYAAGLQGVLEVDDNFSDHLGGDGKIVLFITGPDEFRPGENLSDLAAELKWRGYAIYPIGVAIDEIESPLMYDNLSRMAEMTGGRFYPIEGLNSEVLREALRDAASHASGRVAPRDIVVTETLPSHLEVMETVPAGADVDVAKNPDGTSTLTWAVRGVRPGDSRSLMILTGIHGELSSEGIGAIGWPGGINISAVGDGTAGVNVINMRTEDGDVKIGEIS